MNDTIASANTRTANATYVRGLHGELGRGVEKSGACGFGLTCYGLGTALVKIATVNIKQKQFKQ
uniref:Uncharacterized protein n=1 Tax=Fervidicoccus fontis TaxID=683846 RepID=A0A7J3ZKL1_9CREN